MSRVVCVFSMKVIRSSVLATWLLLLVSLLMSVSSQAARHALLIGNSHYQGFAAVDHWGSLRGPESDVEGIRKSLQSLGFSIQVEHNLSLNAFMSAVVAFNERLQPGDEVFFYYSGHGIGVGDDNYLIPTNAPSPEAMAQMPTKSAIGLKSDVLSRLYNQKPKSVVMVVDACRNILTSSKGNQFATDHGYAFKGLGRASSTASIPSLFFFSTGEKSVARDAKQTGELSVFTAQVVKVLDQPGTLYSLFLQASNNTWQTTEGRQQPEIVGSNFTGKPLRYLRGRPVQQVAQASSVGLASLVSASVDTHDTNTTPQKQYQGQVGRLVPIPAGRFLMGSKKGRSSEKPVREVDVSAFRIMEHEVTWAQYLPCVKDGVCRDNRILGKGDQGWGQENRPVINVSWLDVQAYISWLNQESGQAFRLPSEAEWEYVTRAGSRSPFSWGRSVGKGNANCKGCGSRWDRRKTAPVMSFEPNDMGIYDLHGNVMEWVQDGWHPSYRNAPDTAEAWEGANVSRVVRGGAWSKGAKHMRAFHRAKRQPEYYHNNLGFRLVMDSN